MKGMGLVRACANCCAVRGVGWTMDTHKSTNHSANFYVISKRMCQINVVFDEFPNEN